MKDIKEIEKREVLEKLRIKFPGIKVKSLEDLSKKSFFGVSEK